MFWHTKMLRLIKIVECWAWAEDANLFVGWCNTLLTLIAQTASSFPLKWCVFCPAELIQQQSPGGSLMLLSPLFHTGPRSWFIPSFSLSACFCFFFFLFPPTNWELRITPQDLRKKWNFSAAEFTHLRMEFVRVAIQPTVEMKIFEKSFYFIRFNHRFWKMLKLSMRLFAFVFILSLHPFLFCPVYL